MPLDRTFFLCDAVTLAKKLIGRELIHNSVDGLTSGIIVETEAYAGRSDTACHSHKKKGPSKGARTNVMFGPGGHAYIYLIYGMYHCFNVIANLEDEPEGVLIRALKPQGGVELMRRRRGCADVKNLCSGPGKLCIAMGITKKHYGQDLCEGELHIENGQPIDDTRILATPRINVDYAGDDALLPYRFVIADSPFLSTRRFLPKVAKAKR